MKTMKIPTKLPRILIRGAGDIATGVIQYLFESGFPVLACETKAPSAIRRDVALSEAVYEGRSRVENIEAVLCQTQDEVAECQLSGKIPLIVDPGLKSLSWYQPYAIVDAIIAKRNLGMSRSLAPLTLALGPGFVAGEDVDIVIETMRGHNLGRIIRSGSALPNTGTPGLIGGEGIKRVIHAPVAGTLQQVASIGDIVAEDEVIAEIIPEDGSPAVAVRAGLSGILRGLLREGHPVTPGYKMADVDPRVADRSDFIGISDKARCIGGAVLCALLSSLHEQGVLNSAAYAAYLGPVSRR